MELAEIPAESRSAEPRASNKGFLPLSTDQYLALLDWTCRQARPDKRWPIPAELLPILQRLQLSFNGTIGTQTTMPLGTPDEVRATVHRNLEWAGPRGGLFCCPTHVQEPEVPWENIEAYVAACREWHPLDQGPETGDRRETRPVLFPAWDYLAGTVRQGLAL